jgi:hypothetical protein
MPIIVQQIQTRFKFFQIFWVLQIILIPVIIVFSEFLNTIKPVPVEKDLPAGVLTNATRIDLTFLFSFLSISLIFSLTAIVATIFYAMLTHGIFNYINLNKDSKVNPTWAVWSIFIPFASHILVALNAKKAFESLKLNLPTAKNYLYYAVFSLIFSSILTFGNLFYTIFEVINNNGILTNMKPFMNYNFYISSIAVVISFGLMYFVWKTMKEIKDAIVVENIS